MEEQLLSEQQREEIRSIVKNAFPSDAEIRYSMNEVGRVLFFDVSMERPLEDPNLNIDYKKTAQQALEEMCGSYEELEDYLIDEYQLGTENNFATEQSYLNKIVLDNIEGLDHSLQQRIETSMSEQLEITYDITAIVKKVYEAMTDIISRCLPDDGVTVEELNANKTLSYILMSQAYNPSDILFVRFNDKSQVSDLLRRMNENAVLVNQALLPKYKHIVERFLKQVDGGRKQVEDILLEHLDVLYAELAGEDEFLREFLDDILTSYNYTEYKNGYIISLL